MKPGVLKGNILDLYHFEVTLYSKETGIHVFEK